MNLWLKNPGTNKYDTMLTLATYSLGVILFKLAMSEMTVGSTTFGQMDGAVIAAILTPTLSAYVARRYTEKHKPSKDANEKSN